jgi:hypothetical protein
VKLETALRLPSDIEKCYFVEALYLRHPNAKEMSHS